ncbi:hypothetical protein Hanom_Chr01g00062391 [Helianthus anomalus]
MVRDNVGFLMYEHSRMHEDKIKELLEETLAAVGLKVSQRKLLRYNFISLAMLAKELLRCMKRGMANASEQSRKLPNVGQ